MKTIIAMLLLVPLAALAQAPKMSEISKGTGESLWSFLSRLPGTFEAQVFYAICVFGLVGMLANYFVKWLKKEIAGSLLAYLFVHNPRGSLLSYVTTVGVGLGALQMGIFETADDTFVGWLNVMWITLGNGYLFDAALNKGAQPVSAVVSKP